MKKITQFEEQLLTQTKGFGKKNSYSPEFIKQLDSLEVGNGKLFVSKKEWYDFGYSKATKLPSILNRTFAERHVLFEKEFDYKTYEEGWVISRTK